MPSFRGFRPVENGKIQHAAGAHPGRLSVRTTGDATSLIRFKNVHMRYDTGPNVLSDISFELPEGSFHFLVGQSGAGKSSLLRMLYLGVRPSQGRIDMFDTDITAAARKSLPALRRRIGVVFQDFRLFEHLTVAENVALPLMVAGHRQARIDRNVGELLRWAGLGARMADRPSALSGGEQQRVAIARAVITKPALLLADEPTGNVDNQAGYRLLRLFEELNKTGTTVVIATHNELLSAKFSYPHLLLESGSLRYIQAGKNRRAAS